MRLDDPTASVQWKRSISTVIKEGAVFDPVELLRDVEEMVELRRRAA
jgi:hypothetical protein